MTVEEALELVERVLDNGHLNNVQKLVFRRAWEGQSYKEIAETDSYDTDYIKDVGYKLWRVLSQALGEKVTKHSLQKALRRAAKQKHQQLEQESDHSLASTPQQNWGEASDVSVFYGRSQELALLEQWLLQDRCRLVTLLGMGGIGKTALSIKLAERIQEHFDYIIWRSLRNAPSIQNLLAELLKFLSQQQETNLPETADCGISRLMHYLRQHRCLLVLDNAESIMRAGDRTGGYREGYQEYRELLRRIGEERHNSCLVLTSREKPKELALQEGENLPVRSLQLTGLPPAEGQKIFQVKGVFQGSDDEWKLLIQHYAGNPLALKMVAPAIRDLFHSNISAFLDLLNQGTLVFDDIRNLLDRQFNRLSDTEKELMYWIAINREPVSFLELQQDLVKEISPNELLETLASLVRRSLIEKAAPTSSNKNSDGFTQEPVVMEYMIDQLIEQVCQEIITAKINLFKVTAHRNCVALSPMVAFEQTGSNRRLNS